MFGFEISHRRRKKNKPHDALMCLALAFKPCVPVKPAKSHLAFLSNTGVKWSIAVFNFGSFNTFRACSQFNWALTYVTTQSVRCAVLCCAVASCERSPQVCAIRCIRRLEVVHFFFNSSTALKYKYQVLALKWSISISFDCTYQLQLTSNNNIPQLFL